jgi:hypothetical protein
VGRGMNRGFAAGLNCFAVPLRQGVRAQAYAGGWRGLGILASPSKTHRRLPGRGMTRSGQRGHLFYPSGGSTDTRLAIVGVGGWRLSGHCR